MTPSRKPDFEFIHTGKPLGHLHMTQKQMRTYLGKSRSGKPLTDIFKRIGAYFAYKETLLLEAIAAGIPAPFNAQYEPYWIETRTFFNKNVHSDATNLHKAAEDALFKRDKKCGGTCHVPVVDKKETPRISVKIWRL